MTKKNTLFLVLTLIGASILIMPAYGTTVESGSSIGMSVVTMRTITSAGFVVSGSTPVELAYNIHGTDLDGVPFEGIGTAFMRGSIQEGRGSASDPFDTIEFQEKDSVDGHIYLFVKDMRYNSGWAR